MRGCSRINKISKLLIEDVLGFILFHPNVKPSCVSSDSLTVLNQKSDIKELSSKILMEISVRDLHNDMIKIFDGSGLASEVEYVTHEVLISDTIFR